MPETDSDPKTPESVTQERLHQKVDRPPPYTVRDSFEVEMVRGLARAAAFLEKDGKYSDAGGHLWDSGCRVALARARELGLTVDLRVPGSGGLPSTPDAGRIAIYLETAALGYAEQVRSSMHRTTPPAPAEPWGAWAISSFRGAREFLSTTALSYAAAMGSLDAAQHAELLELRRFRDGVVDLRGGLANIRGPDHRILSSVVETIDALFTVHPIAAGTKEAT